MKEKVTLNVKEQKRLMVLNEILAGRLTGQEAAEVLGLSLRHTRRLIAAYRQEGRQCWLMEIVGNGNIGVHLRLWRRR
jgi:hypothetical protein